MPVEQHKTFYWSIGEGCLVESIPVWENNWDKREEQVYDAGFRHGIYLFAIKDDAQILSFVYLTGRYFGPQPKRFPKHDGSDTSRDQVIALIAGVLLAGNKSYAAYLAKKVPYRISKRYFCTPSLWVWLKAIQYDSPMLRAAFEVLMAIENFCIGYLFALVLIPFIGLWALPFILLSPIPLTVIVAKLCGVKPQFSEVEATGAFTPKLQKQPGIKRLLLRTMYPSFALFLTAMQFYSIGKKSTLLAWYTRWRAPYNNVVRRMFGDETAQPFADGGPCMNDFWPHRHFDISNDVDLRTVEQADNLGVQFHNSIFKTEK